MTVTFLLNGRQVSLEVPPSKRLVDVLREDFHLKWNRPGCYAGVCGTCAVLLNGELAYSCMVPAFAVQDMDVITYEGLEGTQELQDIQSGFEAAGYRPCANCRQRQLLTAYALLVSYTVPEREEIDMFFSNRQCGCTSMSELYKAIEYAINIRRSARHGR